MFHSWRLTCTRHYSHTNNNNEKIISIVSDISSFRTKQHQMQRRQSIHNTQFYSWSGFQQLPFNNGPLSLSLVAFKQMVPGHEIELLLHYVLQHTKHFPSVPLCRNLPFFYHFFLFHSDISAGVRGSHFNECFSCVGNRSIHKWLQHLVPRTADRTIHANLNAKQMLPVFFFNVTKLAAILTQREKTLRNPLHILGMYSWYILRKKYPLAKDYINYTKWSLFT